MALTEEPRPAPTQFLFNGHVPARTHGSPDHPGTSPFHLPRSKRCFSVPTDFLPPTTVRNYFEEFLILNARALSETISTRGSKGRSVPTLIAYYDLVLNEFLKGSNPKRIFGQMRKNPKLAPIVQKVPDSN